MYTRFAIVIDGQTKGLSTFSGANFIAKAYRRNGQYPTVRRATAAECAAEDKAFKDMDERVDAWLYGDEHINF